MPNDLPPDVPAADPDVLASLQPIELAPAQRWALGGLGALAAGAGGVAVFVTQRDVGPVALMSLGSLLLLLCIVGVVPTRLKYKDLELDLLRKERAQAVQRASHLIESSDADERAVVIETVSEVLGPGPSALLVNTLSRDFERMVETTIKAAAGSRHYSIVRDPLTEVGRFDFLVEAERGKQLYVEVKFNAGRLSPATWSRWTNWLRHADSSVRFLLVVDGPVPDTLAAELRGTERGVVISMADRGGAELYAEIMRLLK